MHPLYLKQDGDSTDRVERRYGITNKLLYEITKLTYVEDFRQEQQRKSIAIEQNKDSNMKRK